MQIDVRTEALTRTRRELHIVAEHVLGAQLWQEKHRIGLRQAPGGFATQPFPHDGGERVLAVVGDHLVIDDDDLRGGREVASHPLTTVGEAAAAAGVEPGMNDDVYEPETALEPDRRLEIDRSAARLLARFFALADAALTLWLDERIEDDPAPVQLWPEHFDLATTITEVNYGASPGDDDHPLPYLYVGPWSPPEPGGFWNEPFGASLSLDAIDGVEAAVDFFRTGSTELG